jgi:hypothetical protein
VNPKPLLSPVLHRANPPVRRNARSRGALLTLAAIDVGAFAAAVALALGAPDAFEAAAASANGAAVVFPGKPPAGQPAKALDARRCGSPAVEEGRAESA